MKPVNVRETLIDALRLDLVGPGEVLGTDNRVLGDASEVLPQKPSTWYLTGFLVPIDAATEEKTDEQSAEEVDEVGDAKGTDDAVTPEPAAARVRYLPSSIGISFLVPKPTHSLNVTVRWGDYHASKASQSEGPTVWTRTGHQEQFPIDLPERTDQPEEKVVPNSNGLMLSTSVRPVPVVDANSPLPQGARSVSIFLVNRRTPAKDQVRDQAYVFQPQLEFQGDFIGRQDPRNLESDGWDERVADLQYADACEFAVGHNISTENTGGTSGRSSLVRTCWIPQAEVERVAPPSTIAGVELSMDELAAIQDGVAAWAKLGGLVEEYRAWIERQRATIPASPAQRRETAEALLERAGFAAKRIEQGIRMLDDPTVLEAFRIANRSMAAAARQRLGVMQGRDTATVQPGWRPFQLAFILMNITGLAKPLDEDRNVVDLLFFPTGGGKTEAYLGLAAFTLVLRRLRLPGIASAGVGVLMRYTLRLLTLDQLSRAATLICALELERRNDVEKLGKWPFEIGLWVGQAATPNVMGRKGDGNSNSARARTIAFKNDDRKPQPIPLEECPWCGTRFKPASFNLLPNPDNPTDLRIVCVNRRCSFTGDNALPILAVDEPIYRRLPCFIIATVDKFAAMPWTGDVGQFFGRVHRYDKDGFYGPCGALQGNSLPSGRLMPPDLIIQDELHLISGPLGTIFGLYETTLDELSGRDENGHRVRAKIVASTATVRRAEDQIQALFNRKMVDIFPPPGPDRRDSFFAEVHSTAQSNARRYIGVAAQGRSPKVVMLRVYLALLAAAQSEYIKGKKEPGNPADPYMTLVGYFNSLRELGGARRLVEDEVGTRITGYGSRKRVNEPASLFADRKIDYEVVELTSRVSTDRVAEAKRQLQQTFNEKNRVDVAIATNMISVGLDITRLGLMVVFGQPKTSAEYIQATSRVGRDHERPGLVVTIFNIHKPRDRSHYERFTAYHQSFYRTVEVTSVTPFSPRALDRGLAGALVGLARLGHETMTPPLGAQEIINTRPKLAFAVNALAARARSHNADMPSDEAEALERRVRDRAEDLLDEWAKTAWELQQVGAQLQYQTETGSAKRLLYEFLNPELKNAPPRYQKFRANRSMRDVEASVNFWLKTMDGVDIDEEPAE